MSKRHAKSNEQAVWIHRIDIRPLTPEPTEGEPAPQSGVEITAVYEQPGGSEQEITFGMPLSVWNGLLHGMTRMEH